MINMQHKGLIHIYHGDGKGKTTAAVGMAVRAAGAGLKVCFAQFMKTGNSSELGMLELMSNIKVMPVVNHYGFTWNMTQDDKLKLKADNDKALEELINAVGEYDMIILDEILSAHNSGLVENEKVIKLADCAKGYTELVFTGRNPAGELLSRADYITEMVCTRHPFEKGVNAREGIEF